MFPARFKVNLCCPQDRRTYEGELLWPEVWPEQELRKVELGLSALEKGKSVLSSFAASAQLQQAPVPRGGGVIPREAWKIWPEKTPEPHEIKRTPTGEYMIALPEVSYVLVSVDTAFSEKETADFSACVVLGIWSRRREEISRAGAWFGDRWGGAIDPAEEASKIVEEGGEEQPRAVLMEAWQTRASLNDATKDARGKPIGLVQRLLDTCRRRHANLILIENANRGQDVMRELRRQMHSHEFDVVLFEPSKHGSKLNRMHSVSPLFSSGLVYSPANLIKTFDAFGREQVDVRELHGLKKWCGNATGRQEESKT